ncbi:MAG: inorganic phosphate transporter [Bacteroidia bacterium]|nr:inorganic phosphate transporter [Bacteroidia bacterium]
MFGLGIGLTLLLILCLLCVCAFEFINGFHDTANAVATVIYTRSLKPLHAVTLSGILNGAGVFVGGIAVAVGIINLLPVETLVDQNLNHSIGMVAAILLTAIFWNLGTWYFGIPSSSSHTLIGSIIGVGIAYSLLPGVQEAAVNWTKAGDIGLSLLISPLFGFGLAFLLMFILRKVFKKRPELFQPPGEEGKPPLWIRMVLIATCSAVSFSHGSNDGQKGVGLMMLILIGIVPAHFALNQSLELKGIESIRLEMNAAFEKVDRQALSAEAQGQLAVLGNQLTVLNDLSRQSAGFTDVPGKKRFSIRKDILLLRDAFKPFSRGEFKGILPAANQQEIEGLLKKITAYTDYAPFWVIVLIAISLGIGTMVGWKRIVVTIGEKIGKTHLTYAQGASAELVAASTIAVSTYLGLPVSTTHVLSSGIAGTMFAKGGRENLQKSTLTKIALAWVLTLPVCLVMSGTLFVLFRWMLG